MTPRPWVPPLQPPPDAPPPAGGPRRARALRGRLKLLALRVLVGAAGVLPARLFYALGEGLALGAWATSWRYRAITRDHMDHVLGQVRPGATRRQRDRAALSCVLSVARYWADFARLAHLSPREAYEQIDAFEGLEHLIAAAERGRGVLMFTAHIGNPEYAFRAAAGHVGVPMAAFVERLQPPELNDYVLGLRRRSGVEFFEADLGGVRDALEHLRRGGVLAVVADRDIQHNGLQTPLFGERASLPTGVLELAMRTGAVLLPGVAYRTTHRRIHVRFFPALELPALEGGNGSRKAQLGSAMLEVARALERVVATAPDQWFVLEPIWRGLPRLAHAKQPPSDPRGPAPW